MIEAKKEIESAQTKYNVVSQQLNNKQAELLQKDMDITLVRQVYSVLNFIRISVVIQHAHLCTWILLILPNDNSMSPIGTYSYAVKIRNSVTKAALVSWGSGLPSTERSGLCLNKNSACILFSELFF